MMSSIVRRGPVALVFLCAALATLAAPALAITPRSYDSQISGFAINPEGGYHNLTGLFIDSTDHLWVANPNSVFQEEGRPEEGVISEYDAYPSQTRLSERDGGGHFGNKGYCSIGDDTFALHNSTHYLYVADRCGDLDMFDNTGAFAGDYPIFFFREELGEVSSVAVDNSPGSSNGRVYVAFESGPGFDRPPSHGYVQVLSSSLQKTEHFSAEAPFVKGSRITGTPAGPFGAIADIETDPTGNFYVVDGSKSRVDEFAPSGEFLREFTGAGVPGGINNFFPSAAGLSGVAVDPTNGNVLLVDSGAGYTYDDGRVLEFSPNGTFLRTIDGSETPDGGLSTPRDVAVNSSGYLYVTDAIRGVVDIFNPAVIPPKIAYEEATNPTETSEVLNATVDPNTAGDITACHFEYGTAAGSYALGSATCDPDPAAAPPASNFAVPTQVHAEFTGLTPETTYHYRLVVENSVGTVAKGSEQTFTPHFVHGLRTDPATSAGGTGVTLNGSFLGNGEDTRYYFEWGTTATTAYGHRTAGLPGRDAGSPSGPGRTPVSFKLEGLEPLTKYHYRIVAANGLGGGHGQDESFSTGPSAPLVREAATEVHAEDAKLTAEINPGGEDTEYHFEWGTNDCSVSSCASVPPGNFDLGSSPGYQDVSTLLTGLAPETTYHFRVVATSNLGTGGYDTVFRTPPPVGAPPEGCPNALARQQTGAARLLDCRSYELVSAANSGGYDVESDLVPGQEPFASHPRASGATGPSRVLYAVHGGAIPGMAVKPTNKGVDPYVATRAADGWSTAYVGVPADDPFASGPFSSLPSGADATLTTFAFGAPGGCSPCFEGGYGGIPLRLPDGDLAQGMVSSGVPTPGPAAEPDGYVAKPLSADGTHLIFGSTSLFAPGGNEETGDVSIYDRDLETGETHVVSNTPNGEDFPEPLPCPQGAGACHSPGDGDGIAELDVSSDGSHILLAQRVSVDAAGNRYWRLYMNIGDSPESIDLTPGATHGVLYDGMSEDGSNVFFTTRDALTTADPDEDTSADLYEAQVSAAGTVTVSRVSAGEAGFSGNTDLCDPVENSERQRWNSLGVGANCDAVAIGGGGGVSGGSIYFLSPELLEAGNGTAGQPNLYLVTPGSAPRFVATLDPDDPAVIDAVGSAEAHNSADFQVSADGDFAVFPSRAPLLPGQASSGFEQIYRYEAGTPGTLVCVSCNPTNARVEGDATLASDGTSLLDDGRVFFNTPDPLVVGDADDRQDVYEWEDGIVQLISSGTSPFASSLLGASADGTDAFFFTHDVLAPQDRNGPVTKIYDARAGGGFFVVPEVPPCRSSDECHGAGTQAPPQPDIRTVAGNPGKLPFTKCRPGFAKRHGKCVKKHRRSHRPHRHRGHRHG